MTLRTRLVGLALAAALSLSAFAAAAPDLRKGRDLFFRVGCLSCHKIDGRGGNNGPDLSHAGARLKLDRIVRKVTDPKFDMPNSIMYSADSLKMSRQDVIDVASWLSTLK